MPPRFAFGLFDSEIQASLEFTVLLPQRPGARIAGPAPAQQADLSSLREPLPSLGYKEVNAYGI